MRPDTPRERIGRRGISPEQELYNIATVAGAVPKFLLINDPDYFSIVGGNLQGWADSWPLGCNGAEVVNPPSVVAGVPTFDGTEYMDIDTTAAGNFPGDLTYCLGCVVRAGTANNDMMLSDTAARGLRNRLGKWGFYDGTTIMDSTTSLDMGVLHCITIQCSNGSAIKVWVDGVYDSSMTGTYTQYNHGLTFTLSAAQNKATISEMDFAFAALMLNASDAISGAVGAWGKDYLGL